MSCSLHLSHFAVVLVTEANDLCVLSEGPIPATNVGGSRLHECQRNEPASTMHGGNWMIKLKIQGSDFF
jgi:hypothetical protein